ncbi:hypothetical protein NW762_002804 [Fusarium torreyae]|uniref:Uncharacterized protein n=1 Tax=Fusarium torreyae TaxID=1237075 RepID=A0A9W8SC08_9HYPO|nr:hypothetical protein NW762_002804 [Fusarium torreyae]
MADAYRSVESSGLEIILIAAVVFVLVLILAIFILMGAGLRTSGRARDAEDGQRGTAWSALHQTGQENEVYHDHENSFIKSVRRRSQSFAEELRLELHNLRRNLSLLTIPSGGRLEDTSIRGARRFSIDQLLNFSSASSELDRDCESCYEYLESPLSATGREEDSAGAQRRPTRAAGNGMDPDLEAQQWNSSLL